MRPYPRIRPIDGENVSALLRGEAFRRARPPYWEFDDPNGFSFALRHGRWKLLADRTLTRVRLFDLSADRFEVVDRAGDEPEVVGRLLDELRRRRAEVETDPLRPHAAAPKAAAHRALEKMLDRSDEAIRAQLARS